jgi:aspartyl-tRNA(Asn)/glutamyl-tRNA(Gln) amidotransferase subunit B
VNETRHWDERRSITISLRLKEGEQDYRYFPEPDLPAVVLSEEFVERVRVETPEVPEARANRYVRDYSLTAQVAMELSRNAALSRLFEETVAIHRNGPDVANWITGESRAEVQKTLMGPGRETLPRRLAELLAMISQGKMTRVQAKEVFRGMLAKGESASSLAGQVGGVVTDEVVIGEIVGRVLRESGAEEARTNPKAFNYLVGQVLRAERRADPRVVAKLLRQKLEPGDNS